MSNNSNLAIGTKVYTLAGDRVVIVGRRPDRLYRAYVLPARGSRVRQILLTEDMQTVEILRKEEREDTCYRMPPWFVG